MEMGLDVIPKALIFARRLDCSTDDAHSTLTTSRIPVYRPESLQIPTLSKDPVSFSS